MRLGFLIAVIILSACVQRSQADSATAPGDARAALASGMATYLAHNKTEFAKKGGVEIGAAAIGADWAVADFRTHDRSEHGQLLFKNVSGCWDMRLEFESTEPLAVDDLVNSGAPNDVASKLVADLAKAETQSVTYLPVRSSSAAGSACK